MKKHVNTHHVLCKIRNQDSSVNMHILYTMYNAYIQFLGFFP